LGGGREEASNKGWKGFQKPTRAGEVVRSPAHVPKKGREKKKGVWGNKKLHRWGEPVIHNKNTPWVGGGYRGGGLVTGTGKTAQKSVGGGPTISLTYEGQGNIRKRSTRTSKTWRWGKERRWGNAEKCLARREARVPTGAKRLKRQLRKTKKREVAQIRAKTNEKRGRQARRIRP